MQIGSIPIQKAILQQIVSQVGISNKKHQQSLKNQLDRKYQKHINLIQYHQLREDRFVESQKKVLEKQHISLQKTKQDKATQNKYHSIMQRNKRVESNLNKWEHIVDKNKEDYEKKLKESLHLIKQWNEKLSESSSRKSMRLSNVSKTLQQRSNEKVNKVQSQRRQAENARQSRLKNPQKDNFEESQSRYARNSEVKKHSRVSTESLHYRSKKNEQDLLQKSLIKIGQKNEKITQARVMKQLLFQKKHKMLQEKEDNLKKIRDYRLNLIQQQLDERNDLLDQKYKNDRIKARSKKSSLPSVSGTKAASVLFLNGPGEEWRSPKNSHQPPISPSEQSLKGNMQGRSGKTIDFSPNYDKIIVEKLRNVALLVRKGKKI